MTKPRQVAPKYERNIPYTSISLTFPARDAIREMSANLTGLTGRRVGLSETLLFLCELANPANIVDSSAFRDLKAKGRK